MGKYKIKNSEIKKVSRNVAETAKRFNTPRVMHWADKLDHSKSMTYVSTLASRIKEENEVDYDKIITYKTPLKIQHPLFRLSANYHLGNLPKLKDWDHNSLNFSFGKTGISRRLQEFSMRSAFKSGRNVTMSPCSVV